ncbi:MAG: alginate export family protein [Bdellovibrionales bacterium]|nr:alginate export family protein [Bdellovibrionales bacterium]
MMGCDDKKLIERDGALPGLRYVLDSSFAAYAVQRLTGAEVQGVSPRPYYLRYKPGQSCLCAYQYSDGQQPLYLYLKCLHPSLAEKQAKERREKHPVNGVSSVFAYPSDGVFARALGADRHIKGLRHLQTEPGRAAIGKQVFRSKGRIESFQSLRYKPERRYVACAEDGSGEKVLLKFYSDQELAQVRQHLALCSTIDADTWAAPVGVDTKRRCVVYPWMDGIAFEDLSPQELVSGEIAQQTSALLRRVHRSAVPPAGWGNSWNPAQRALALLQDCRVIVPDVVERASHLVGRALACIHSQSARPVLTHGDFHFGQLIRNERRVVGIDFDNAEYGPAELDFASLLAHVTVDQRIDFDDCQGLAERLVAAYEDGACSICPEALHAFTALAAFGLILSPFRQRVQDWGEGAERILKLSELWLAAAQPRRYWGYGSVAATETCWPSDKRHALDESLSYIKPLVATNGHSNPLSGVLKASGVVPQCAEVSAVTLLRVKPKKRCLLEIDVRWADSAGPQQALFIAKSRVKGIPERSLRAHHALWQRGFGVESEGHVAVPELVLREPEYRLWAYRKVQGQVMTARLHSKEVVELHRQVARAAYSLHSASLEGLRYYTIDDEIDALLEKLDEVGARHPQDASAIAAFVAPIESLRCMLRGSYDAVIHRDFYFDQLLLRPTGGLCFLDLDLICYGDPALDIGNYVAHLVELGLRQHGDAGYFQGAIDGLTSTYVRLAGAGVADRIEGYTTLSLLRHLYLCTAISGREHIRPSLMILCKERLAVWGEKETVQAKRRNQGARKALATTLGLAIAPSLLFGGSCVGQPRDAAFDFSAPPATDAEVVPGLFIGNRVEVEATAERNFNLDRSSNEDLGSVDPTWSFAARYHASPSVELFTNLEPGLSLVEDKQNRKDDQTTFDVTQAYADVATGVADSLLRLGRQRIVDSREWVIDEEVDGILLQLERWGGLLGASVFEVRGKDVLRGENEARGFYSLLRYDAQVVEEDRASAFLLYRNEYSAEDEQTFHFVIQKSGELPNDVEYWGSASYVYGDANAADIRAYGFDVGGTVEGDTSLKPTVIVGFAMGSGDSRPEGGSDTNFRQTGLQDNDAKLSGKARVRYYGELFDPELSNMLIYTLGGGIRPSKPTSIELLVHHYQQHQRVDVLRDSAIDADLTGESRSLGHEVDLIIAYKADSGLKASLALGYFEPGAAFEDTDEALFAEAKVRYEF